MAKVFAVFLVFFACFAGETTAMKNSCYYLAAIGGGCPDENACLEVCQPCYRGIGRIEAKCNMMTGIPIWQCQCFFLDGAPCPPVGPPKCPGWPPSSATNNTTSGVGRATIAFSRAIVPLFLVALSLFTLLSVV